MLRPIALTCVVALLLAGCAGQPATQALTTSSAAAPLVDAETGSIAGNVTDEELLPVVGADVALVEGGVTTKTDSEGRFAINGLAPGSYTLLANRLGYEQVGKKVSVVAGEVTTANLQMRAIVFAPDPYHVSIPSSFYITFGWGLFDAFVTWRISNATCNPCQRMIDFERAPLSTVAEPIWTPSVNTPATNKVLYVWTERNVGQTATGSSGENVWSEYIDNREQHWFTDAELAKLKEFKDFRVNVGGGVTDVMVQQKVEVWMSFGYVAKLPDGFSALPPA